MSPREPPIRSREPSASRYALEIHCCAESPPPRSRSIAGRATLTIEPSIVTTAEPRIAARSVSSWWRVTVSRNEQRRPDHPPALDGADLGPSGCAARSASGIVMRRELEQKRVQRPALAGLERSEELLLHLARDLTQAGKLLLPGRFQAHHVAPAVCRIASPFDQVGLLELVEQADEPAAVVSEGVGDRGLRLHCVLVEDGEDGVVI